MAFGHSPNIKYKVDIPVLCKRDWPRLFTYAFIAPLYSLFVNMADVFWNSKCLCLLMVFTNKMFQVNAACTFPSDFQNTWMTNSRGTWTVNSSHISNFQTKMTTSGNTLYTMACNEAFSGYYVLKSEELFNTTENVYTCLYIEKQSSAKYTYSLLTTLSTVATDVTERVSTSSTALTGSAVCDDTEYTTSGERTYVALLSGSESQGKTTCPDVIQGIFTYIGTTCNSTNLDICTDTSTLTYNTDTCSESMMFSQNGTLYCVNHVLTSGYYYITLYNNDPSTPDGTTYFQFSCLVLFSSGTYVLVSVSPMECQSGQLPLIVPTGGYVTSLQNDEASSCYTAPVEEESIKTTLIIVAVVLGVVCCILIVVIIVCLYKYNRIKKRRRHTRRLIH
ncbi:uncharacterized protein LOC132543918 [Ylistrum balloti]|uniref:uncharacterized protein LOC132543918 n=1 Tax=Ylistrum balloti TaxID=509963 RepID=UPI002905D226|nr:uncharacterized protein LOC132543918 [Ylistrum balloti]